MRKILFGLFIALAMLMMGCDSAPDSGHASNTASGSADSDAVAAAFKRANQHCLEISHRGCMKINNPGVIVEKVFRVYNIPQKVGLGANNWSKEMLKEEIPPGSWFVAAGV